jgi:hypothetical protein
MLGNVEQHCCTYRWRAGSAGGASAHPLQASTVRLQCASPAGVHGEAPMRIPCRRPRWGSKANTQLQKWVLSSGLVLFWQFLYNRSANSVGDSGSALEMLSVLGDCENSFIPGQSGNLPSTCVCECFCFKRSINTFWKKRTLKGITPTLRSELSYIKNFLNVYILNSTLWNRLYILLLNLYMILVLIRRWVRVYLMGSFSCNSVGKRAPELPAPAQTEKRKTSHVH